MFQISIRNFRVGEGEKKRLVNFEKMRMIAKEVRGRKVKSTVLRTDLSTRNSQKRMWEILLCERNGFFLLLYATGSKISRGGSILKISSRIVCTLSHTLYRTQEKNMELQELVDSVKYEQ